MFPPHAHAHVHISKTPEQIRDEAAKATAADLAAVMDALCIAPDDNTKLLQGVQLFWRHREEILRDATTLHMEEPGVSSAPSTTPPS